MRFAGDLQVLFTVLIPPRDYYVDILADHYQITVFLRRDSITVYLQHADALQEFFATESIESRFLVDRRN